MPALGAKAVGVTNRQEARLEVFGAPSVWEELRRNYAGYTVSPGELVQMNEELLKLALDERDLRLARDILMTYHAWLTRASL